MLKMLQPAKFEYLYILSAKTTMLLWWWGLLLNKVHQDVVTPHMPAVNSSKLQSCSDSTQSVLIQLDITRPARLPFLTMED